MAGLHIRDQINEATSWEVCMAKSYCKWPVIAGIAIGGLLLVPIVWCCGRLICCHAFRTRGRRGPKGSQNSKQPSGFHPPISQGYKPAPQPPPYESPKNAQIDCNNHGKVTPESPHPWPGQAPHNSHDDDVELGRLDPAHAPNSSMLAHQEPPPMARLGPLSSRNPHGPQHQAHDSLQRPLSSRHTSHSSQQDSFDSSHRRQDSSQHRHHSLHASHNSLHAQNPFSDPLPVDDHLHEHRPPSPPRSYVPLVPQRPYSPYLPYPPVSPYTTGTKKYEPSVFVEHQKPYRAYSPSVSTHYEPSIWNEPVELPSPYNKRPESLIFASESQAQLVNNNPMLDMLPSQHRSEPARRASPLQSETKGAAVEVQQPELEQSSFKISQEPDPEVNPVTGGASPPARTPTPGRAL